MFFRTLPGVLVNTIVWIGDVYMHPATCQQPQLPSLIDIYQSFSGTAAYSHDIDPHSYDVDPLEEGMAFKEQSLFACKQAVVQLYKDITFSFSWTLHRE